MRCLVLYGVSPAYTNTVKRFPGKGNSWLPRGHWRDADKSTSYHETGKGVQDLARPLYQLRLFQFGGF